MQDCVGNVGVSDLTIDDSNRTGGSTINMNGVCGGTVKNLYVISPPGTVINATKSTDIDVDNVIVDSSRRAPMIPPSVMVPHAQKIKPKPAQ